MEEDFEFNNKKKNNLDSLDHFCCFGPLKIKTRHYFILRATTTIMLALKIK